MVSARRSCCGAKMGRPRAAWEGRGGAPLAHIVRALFRAGGFGSWGMDGIVSFLNDGRAHTGLSGRGCCAKRLLLSEAQRAEFQ